MFEVSKAELLYVHNICALLLCNWAKHMAGFVGRYVCTWGADFITVFFFILPLRLTL